MQTYYNVFEEFKGAYCDLAYESLHGSFMSEGDARNQMKFLAHEFEQKFNGVMVSESDNKIVVEVRACNNLINEDEVSSFHTFSVRCGF
jgi:hypothetical protein